MSFELIEAEKGNYPKALMCRALGLSRSGHHAFTTRGPSRRELEDERLDVLVAAAFAELKGRYGAPRIEKELRARGHRTSKKRVADSMARQGLISRPRRRWKKTTDSSHAEPVAPNRLARNFTTDAPDKVWVGDTTYLPVLGGFLFLVVILDLFSRKVVGWAMAARMAATLVCDALTMALWRRKRPEGVVAHSDRGGQYCSAAYQALLAKHKLVCSMSKKGDCYDNAAMESWNHSFKVEAIHGERFATRDEAKQHTFEYIEVYYNRKRLHSKLGYLSPEAFELKNVA